MGGRLRTSIVSDQHSWINDSLVELFLKWVSDGHAVAWTHDVAGAPTGDLCFYLSCGQLASAEILARFKHNLVVHESNLPSGRGWSPLSWQILSGASEIAVTLFEAESTIDSGAIYAQEWLHFDGTELVSELRAAPSAATVSLCMNFVRDYPQSATLGRPQVGEESRYRRRTPADSFLNPAPSLAEQFDLLRIVDNERYPATLDLRGASYRVSIERVTD